jgi:hypothetical protein
MVTSLSRSGSTSPLGKLSYETKVRVAELVGEELERQARSLGMGIGEYIREILTIKALGYDHVRMAISGPPGNGGRKRDGNGAKMKDIAFALIFIGFCLLGKALGMIFGDGE